jgi:uncharacterized integral membrane protein
MTTWQKIKFWTKWTILGLLILYIVLLLTWNGRNVDVWVFFGQPLISAPVWVLMISSFLAGSLVTIVGGWMFRGYLLLKKKQQEKTTRHLADEIADMKRKAEMLQTKESPAPAGATSPTDVTGNV